MSQNLNGELRGIREDLTSCLKETFPSKEFRATLIMAMVGLHVIEARMRKTQNLNERRQLINKFNKGKGTIEKGIRALKKSAGTRARASGEQSRRAVS